MLVLLVTTVWYPPPLFELAKGREIFLILVGCDITLGPLLTFVIFNVRKPRAELIRDVAIIATVQFSAMVYGVWTLLQARPAYIAYNAGQFNVPLATELTNGDADKSGVPDDKKPSAPWFGPVLVGTKMPEDQKEKERLLFSSVSGRGDVFQIPRFFVPYENVESEVAARAQSIEQISNRLGADKAKIEKAASKYAGPGVSIGALPLVIRTTTALAIVDRQSGKFFGVVPIESTH